MKFNLADMSFRIKQGQSNNVLQPLAHKNSFQGRDMKRNVERGRSYNGIEGYVRENAMNINNS